MGNLICPNCYGREGKRVVMELRDGSKGRKTPKDGINFAGWTDSMVGAVNAASANHRLPQGHLERLGI